MQDNDPDFVIHCVSRFNDHQLIEWHERAAIYEYDAGMERMEAEYKAAMDILSEIAHTMRRKGHK